MGSVNLHIVVGMVGQDPVLRTTQTGKSVCELSVATNDGDKDRNTGKDIANWHKLVCFGKTAEFVSTYIGKGTTIWAQGKVKMRTWDKKDGSGKGYTKETLVDRIEALSKTQKNDNPPMHQPPQGNYPNPNANSPAPIGQLVNQVVGNSQFAPNTPVQASREQPAHLPAHQQVPVNQPNIPAPTQEIPNQVPMNANQPPLQNTAPPQYPVLEDEELPF